MVDKTKQRVPFGRNGIMDGNGKIIRTDHMSMRDVLADMWDGTPSRHDNIDQAVEDAEAGRVRKEKRKQNKAAGIATN